MNIINEITTTILMWGEVELKQLYHHNIQWSYCLARCTEHFCVSAFFIVQPVLKGQREFSHMAMLSCKYNGTNDHCVDNGLAIVASQLHTVSLQVFSQLNSWMINMLKYKNKAISYTDNYLVATEIAVQAMHSRKQMTPPISKPQTFHLRAN